MSHSPYTTRASKRLQDALKEFAEAENDRFSLEAEIDLARLLTERAVRIFDAAHYGEKEGEINPELKAASRQALLNNLQNVMSLVEKAAKVMALTRGLYTPKQVQQMMMSVTRIVERYVTDESKLKAIMTEFNDIKTTNENAKAGTTIIIT